MGVSILFFSAVAVFAVWWLSKHRLASKPWLEQGTASEFPGAGVSQTPVAKVGLTVLLASLAALFALFISAYVMRMQFADWRPVAKPTLLWVNTGVLMLSSAALQRARVAAEHDDEREIRAYLVAAGSTALAFLIGQIVAWQQLVALGYALASNPANAFFYLITGLHGLHVVGGLVALGWVMWRRSRAERPDVRLGLALCGMYWDFLLLIWLVLFGLLLLT